MSYVDEVLAYVVAKNPAQPEFHQAVKEVLESLRVVIEANEEEYRKDALLERLITPERVITPATSARPPVLINGTASDVANKILFICKYPSLIPAVRKLSDFLGLCRIFMFIIP